MNYPGLQMSVKPVRQAYQKGQIPAKLCCQFARLDLDRAKSATQGNERERPRLFLRNKDLRSTTVGACSGAPVDRLRRDRLSHSTPFANSIGQIPLSALHKMDVELSCRSPPGHSRFTNQVQPFSLRLPGGPTIRGIEQRHSMRQLTKNGIGGRRGGGKSGTLCPQSTYRSRRSSQKEGQNEPLTSNGLPMEVHWKYPDRISD